MVETNTLRLPFRNLKNAFDAVADNKNRLAGAKAAFENQAAEAAENAKVTSPYALWRSRIQSLIEATYPPGTEILMLREPIQAGDPDFRGDVAVDDEFLTEEQVRRVRILVLPLDRANVLDDMGRLVLGNQFDEDVRKYPPSFWFSVLRSYKIFDKKYNADSNSPERCFDMLFGYTYHLWQNDRWMTHHGRGWGGEKMVAALALHWKRLLKLHSPKSLGLDHEVSYPSVLWFLHNFKTTLESVEMYGDPPLIFKYS